jgi:TPR repeat protein
LEILRFAVEHRQHESYFLLGDMYELGRPGVLGQNRVKAAQLFALSAEASRLAAINHSNSANASSVSASAASSHALAAASAQTICKDARVRLTVLVSSVTAEMLIQSCIEPDSEEHPHPAALIEAAQLFEKGRAAIKAVPGVSPGFPGLAGSAISALEWYVIAFL